MPTGHLRYWDGARWTQHQATETTPESAWGWIGRHKVTVTLTAVLLVAWVTSLASAAGPGGSNQPEETPTGASAITSTHAQTSDRSDKPAQSNRPHAKPVRPTPAGPARTSATQQQPRPTRSAPAGPVVSVARVVDGDTIELGNGESVRLVGIDTPEVGECGYAAASAALSRLVLGKMVRLTVSDEDRDHYGRLLRYVNIGSIDAGLHQIKHGLAIAAYDSRDGYGFHPREPAYVAADNAVRNVCPMSTGQHLVSAPKPSPRPLMGGGGSCSTGYLPCLPAGPDLDCADVNGPVRVTGNDPYRLDADGDGWGCDT